MGYAAACDDCGSRCRPSPALLAELSTSFMRTDDRAAELVAAGYQEGDTITLCPDCAIKLLVM